MLHRPLWRTRDERNAPERFSLQVVGEGSGDSGGHQLDRTPPQDNGAEQSVLGAMLLSKDAIADRHTIVGVYRQVVKRPRTPRLTEDDAHQDGTHTAARRAPQTTRRPRITDAGTALQTPWRWDAPATRWGSLIDNAKRKGLFAAHSMSS